MRTPAATAAPLFSIMTLLACVGVAGVVVGAAARSDAGRLVDVVTIEPGDTVLGDIRVSGEIDEIRVVLPRGTATSWSVARTSPGNLAPAVGGLLNSAFDQVPLLVFPPYTLRSEGVPASGMYRFLMANAEETVGSYRVKFAAKPAKSFTASGTSDIAPAPLPVGAFAGAVLDVSLSWTGPAPVTLTSLAGPGGAPLGGATAPLVRGRTSTQRGFLVTATGDQTAVIAVPAGTTKWSARVSVRSPRFTPQTHDVRVEGVVEEAPFEVIDVGYPFCQLLDEEGGPNIWVLTGVGRQPSGGPLDSRRGNCTVTPFGGTFEDATEYLLTCSSGYRARLTEVVRDGAGRVASFEAPLLADPSGTGSASYDRFEYDTAGRATSWREVRRFAGTGRVHTFEYSGIERFGNGATLTCRIDHTDPAGRTRTWIYGPYR